MCDWVIATDYWACPARFGSVHHEYVLEPAEAPQTNTCYIVWVTGVSGTGRFRALIHVVGLSTLCSLLGLLTTVLTNKT